MMDLMMAPLVLVTVYQSLASTNAATLQMLSLLKRDAFCASLWLSVTLLCWGPVTCFGERDVHPALLYEATSIVMTPYGP